MAIKGKNKCDAFASPVHNSHSRADFTHQLRGVQFTASSLESSTAIMVFTAHLRVLHGIILLSCVQSVVNENVDINTLSRIQRFFHRSYESAHGQYAVAINVPKTQCRRRFYPSEDNFLRNDQSDQVQPNSHNVYIGNEIITAGHRIIEGFHHAIVIFRQGERGRT
ncbi:hypothetical protein G5714_015396 [Onychostoma macrolepis]|uniref:Uncharacterized protein n=1 Tax=Onychostoma macrolepis TaxID=369639 RepID=A0A7J6CAS5_9TELE|nr:hypothetical protein G5714_015396 [Onychostoma macrolepis]